MQKLMPHQIQALDRLVETGGRQLLHIGCGGGKTLTSLEYIDRLKAKNVLIVAPASLLGVWTGEASKWFGWDVVKIKGTPKERKDIYENWKEGIYVIGYETMVKDFKELSARNFDVLIAEESHRIKNPTAKCTKSMFKLGFRAKSRIALTGTAMPGGWKDIWSQVNFVQPGSLYPSYWIFRSVHCVMPVPQIPMITGYRSLDVIKEKIKPFVLTIPKEDIDRGLPPVTFQDLNIDLSDEEWKSYKQMRDEMRLELSDGRELTIANALVLIGRLKMATNGLFYFGLDIPSSKMQALKDLVESIPDDQKVVIFSQFSSSAKEIQKELHTPYLVYGESKDKDLIVDKWRKDGRILVGTGSLGTGWNLQDASYCINYDLPYTNSEYEQRISRLIRVGQLRHVHVYNLLTNGTVDAHIKKILEKKKNMTDDLVEWTKEDIDILLQ